ncbi:FecR domain-containing protein [Longitalea arenae]|uniref:FecR domain-containing protein n=1 Tax=Longitalea arenae TaxID=2812558 RepID=UPI0019686663|nr:FecR domain-containing protein [Longitalea arenae]
MPLKNEACSIDEYKDQTFVNAYNEFYPLLKYVSYNLLANKDDAEAVTLNAFMQLGTSKALFKSIPYIKDYLFNIMLDACSDTLRHKKPQKKWVKESMRVLSGDKRLLYLLLDEAASLAELVEIIELRHYRPSKTSSPLMRYLTGGATDAEIMQVEEWASLSVENRNWLNRSNNFSLIRKRYGRMEKIYREANASDCLQHLEYYQRIKSLKRKRMRRSFAAAAAVCILFFAAWLHNHDLLEVAQKQPVAQTTPVTINPAANHKPTHATSHLPDSTDQPSRLHLPADTAENIELTPAAPAFVSKNAHGTRSVLGPRKKEHVIINKERTILPSFLPDGSAFILNAGSEIGYSDPFDTSNRRITLEGEAYFNLVQNADQPLLVRTKNALILSYGGSFNVHSYSNGKQTTVTALTGDNLTVQAGTYQAQIEAGETAIIQRGAPIELYNRKNVEKIVAYTRKLFYFENDNVNDVAREIARWYGLTVAGNDSSHTRVSFRGSRLVEVTDVIKKLVTSDGQCHLTLKGNELIIH